MVRTRGTNTGTRRGDRGGSGKRGGDSGREGSSGRGGDNGLGGKEGVKKASPPRSPSNQSSDSEDESPRPPVRGGKAAPKKAASKKTASRFADADEGGPATRLRDRTSTASPPTDDAGLQKAFSPKNNLRKPSARDVTEPNITLEDMKELKKIPLAKRPPGISPRHKRKAASYRVDDDGAIAKLRRRRKRTTDSLTTKQAADIKKHQRCLTGLIDRMRESNGDNPWMDVIATLQGASDRLDQIRDGNFDRAIPSAPSQRNDDEGGRDEEDQEDQEPRAKKGKEMGGRKKR
jgi:hypothetical protein